MSLYGHIELLNGRCDACGYTIYMLPSMCVNRVCQHCMEISCQCQHTLNLTIQITQIDWLLGPNPKGRVYRVWVSSFSYTGLSFWTEGHRDFNWKVSICRCTLWKNSARYGQISKHSGVFFLNMSLYGL